MHGQKILDSFYFNAKNIFDNEIGPGHAASQYSLIGHRNFYLPAKAKPLSTHLNGQGFFID